VPPLPHPAQVLDRHRGQLGVYVGDRDILRLAVDTSVEHAGRDGATLRFHEVSSMFRVWMTRAIPEGRRTRKELAGLVGTQRTSTPGGCAPHS
jgi:hypothetical protein